MIFKEAWNKTSKQLRSNIFLFLGVLLIELIFLFAYAITKSIFSFLALEQAKELVVATKERSALDILNFNTASTFGNILNKFFSHQLSLMVIGLAFILVFTIIWIIFQGKTWYLLQCIFSSKRPKFKTGARFMWNFTKLTLVWLFFALIVAGIFLKLAIPSWTITVIYPHQTIIIWLGIIVEAVLAFYFIISYSFIDEKKPIKEILMDAVSKITTKIHIYLFIISIFFMLSIIFLWLQSITPWMVIKLFLGLVTTIPLISITKLYLKNVAAKL